MKSMMFLNLGFVILICIGCSSEPSQGEVQTAIANTQLAIEPTKTFIPTPTTSDKEIYCQNIGNLFGDLESFHNSIADFVEYLQTDSGMPTKTTLGEFDNTWGDWLDMFLSTGTLGSSSWRNHDEKKFIDSFNTLVDLTRQIEYEGLNLKLGLTKVVVPLEVDLAQENILECYDDAIDSATLIANFLEEDLVFYTIPGFGTCSRLDIYYDAIGDFCGN